MPSGYDYVALGNLYINGGTLAASAGQYVSNLSVATYGWVVGVQVDLIPPTPPPLPQILIYTGTPTDGQYVAWQASTGTWIPVTGSGGGGGAGSDTTALHYTADSPSTAQIKQALLNITAMPTLRPEQFGAAADGVTDDSIPFYLCKVAGLAQSAAGFVMQLQQGVSYYLGQAAHTAHSLTSLFDLATGVYVMVPGGSGRGNTAATRIITDHTFTGYAIAPAAGTQGCGISGVLIESNMSPGYSGVCKGVSFGGVEWGHLRDVGIGNYSDISWDTVGSVDLHMENLSLGHDVTGRTLTDYTPTWRFGGTDHVCINIESNGGNTNATIGTISNSNFYNAAIQCYDLSTAKCYGVNGEFGDCGWYMGGTSGGVASTFVTLNQFVDIRGDYNAGHGVVLNGAGWNHFGNVTVYNNSNNSNGAYDGVNLASSVVCLGNRFATVIGGSPAGAANIMGYYYHDTATTGAASQLDANMVATIGGERQGMAYDYALTAMPYRLPVIKGGGAGSYAFRPPSRHASGTTWTDLFTPTVPVLTYSDSGGAVNATTGNGGWRLAATNAINGNLLNSLTVECLGGSTAGWLTTTATGFTSPPVTTATASLSAVCFNTVAAIIQKLGNNQILKVTSNGAAAYSEALTLAAITGVAASTAYAACVSTVAATTARSVEFLIDCFNSSGAFISTITDGAPASNSTTAVSTHALTFTTPALTAAIQIRVRFVSAASGEVHYIGLTSVDTHSTQTVPVYA